MIAPLVAAIVIDDIVLLSYVCSVPAPTEAPTEPPTTEPPPTIPPPKEGEQEA